MIFREVFVFHRFGRFAMHVINAVNGNSIDTEYNRFIVSVLNSVPSKKWKTRSYNFQGIPDRSSQQKCSTKNSVLKKFPIFTGKHLCWSLFLIKLVCNFIKGTPTQLLSCEYCEIFQNSYFEEHLRTAAFIQRRIQDPIKQLFLELFREKHSFQKSSTLDV